jgi:hypothetical protein
MVIQISGVAALSEARPVLRELLIAGLAPETLRYCVEESCEATAAAKSSATKKSVLGFLTGRLFGFRCVGPRGCDDEEAVPLDGTRRGKEVGPQVMTHLGNGSRARGSDAAVALGASATRPTPRNLHGATQPPRTAPIRAA